MRILKRKGFYQNVSFDKILDRINNLKNNINPVLTFIDEGNLTQNIISRIYDGISSKEIDELSAQLSIEKRFEHIDYEILASRIIISNLHKTVHSKFSDAMEEMYSLNAINDRFIEFVRDNKKILNNMIKNNKDYTYDYFAYKTLEKSYLFKNKKVLVETPQYMLLRTAIGVHYFTDQTNEEKLEIIQQSYNFLSDKYFTHASPTLFNSGSNREQLASCYLLGIEDSMKGIYKCLSDCAIISKYAGGIGIHISNIRAKGSIIRSTNGISDGIVKMLKVFNATALYSNQSGRRNGSIAVYLEPWHADIFDFLELPLETGDENRRARDLFYALWVPDLFMKHVKEDLDWWLMCPDECPGLQDTYSNEFEELYFKYVSEGKFRKKVKARQLWDHVLTTQIETGVPYISYKDTVNRNSNQKNLGVIKSSNLCNEINIYSDTNEYGVCNLASISLPAFVLEDNTFDYDKLEEVVRIATINLNNIIDVNFYPVPETDKSNKKHRPIGIGVQGLANLFYTLKVPFDSQEAEELNYKIFETIYYSALKTSNELAKKYGPYKSFEGSDFSKGILQFDYYPDTTKLLRGYDWDALKANIIKYGTRNSLLTACMPTASTSNILNNFESFEPATYNIFMRSVISGDYSIVNRYLIKDLYDLGLWNESLFNKIKANYGSIQNIDIIPQHLKDLYKDVYEIKQKTLIKLSAIRQCFIDQSQSLNIYFSVPTISKLTSLHFETWSKGLKTGMYYLRSEPASNAAQFTVTSEQETSNNENIKDELQNSKLACSIKNRENCMMCSG